PAQSSTKRARAYAKRSCLTGLTGTTILTPSLSTGLGGVVLVVELPAVLVAVVEPESDLPLLPQPAASATVTTATSRHASSGGALRRSSRPSIPFGIPSPSIPIAPPVPGWHVATRPARAAGQDLRF